MKVKYQFHPIADQFPTMSDAEFEALVEDIRENGLQEPICLLEGKILDGRNRYRACLELGIEPVVKHLHISRSEAAVFSVSQNLQRRHLTKSQQAMYIVKAGLLGAPKTSGAKRRYRTGDSAIRRISERYGVSHVSIYKAMFVHEHDDERELAKDVLDGKLSVAKAEAIIRAGSKESGTGARDSVGRKVPAKLREVFSLADDLGKVDAQLNRVRNRLEGLPAVAKAEARPVQEQVQIAIDGLASVTAHSVCRRCAGKGCANCGGKGWRSVAEWKRASKGAKNQAAARG